MASLYYAARQLGYSPVVAFFVALLCTLFEALSYAFGIITLVLVCWLALIVLSKF